MADFRFKGDAHSVILDEEQRPVDPIAVRGVGTYAPLADVTAKEVADLLLLLAQPTDDPGVDYAAYVTEKGLGRHFS